MKRIYKIIFLSIFTSASVFSQGSEKNYSIQLNSTGGILLYPYKILVERNQSNIKVQYKRKIRTKNSKKLKEETLEYLKHSNTEDQKNRLSELIEKKTKYKKVRIRINESDYLPYFQLLDSIFNADWENIKSHISTKNQIILDGYTIELKVIKSDTLINSTYIHSGYLRQVPLLLAFKNETFNLYSKFKGKLF